jgi:hypothetical protein
MLAHPWMSVDLDSQKFAKPLAPGGASASIPIPVVNHHQTVSSAMTNDSVISNASSSTAQSPSGSNSSASLSSTSSSSSSGVDVRHQQRQPVVVCSPAHGSVSLSWSSADQPSV